MKQITLKPVSIPLPRNIDLELRRALHLAEEAIRENNALIEDTLNNLIKEQNNGRDE